MHPKSKKMKKITLFLAMTLCLAIGRAERPDSIWYGAELTASLSGGAYTPLWLASNRQGLGSVKKDFGYVRGGVFGEMRKGKKFSWGFGADLVGAWRSSAPFVIHQLYGEVRYWNAALTIGSKEQHPLFNDIYLSSGDLLFSGNARPIPQIRLELPDYLNIPYLRGWAAIKGYVSYGFFTDSGWQRSFTTPDAKRTEGALFHSKGGWLRIGDETRFPLTFEGGLEMAAQWGGKSISGGKVIYMPHHLKDAIKTFFFGAGGHDTPIGEQTNVYGNHVGEWSASLKWQAPKWSVRAYYEHFFEDHSMLFFDYAWKDMLLGLEAELPANRFVSKVVYEYLNTKDQASSVYWDHTPELPEQVSGRDSYYNHSIYTGWQHWGMGIGNPLIIAPAYNRDGNIYFRCNRIVSHHIGFKGQPWPRLGYRFLASSTTGWGTYDTPFRNVRHNVNLLLEATYSAPFWSGFSVTAGLGADFGSLLGRSTGLAITFRKTGSIL